MSTEQKLVPVEVIDPFFIDGEAKDIGEKLDLPADVALTLASANRVKLADLQAVKKRQSRGE